VSTHVGDAQAIQHLKRAVASGENWYLALVEAIKLWVSTEENYNGRYYRYLIDNEAFDFLALAERLCGEIDGFIPEEELVKFLFFGRPPVELSRDEFKQLIGDAKYKAYLNYLYGILAEQFLHLAVTEEIRKEQQGLLARAKDEKMTDEMYRRIYGAGKGELLNLFRREKHYPQLKSITLTELNEFTYWLFKYRMKTGDKSRIASDTKKALLQLQRCWELKTASKSLCQLR
jgi:hypothetical protein